MLDPSVMPSVGNPEPGGMGWRELTGLLGAVAAERRIVGFDVVEAQPWRGPGGGRVHRGQAGAGADRLRRIRRGRPPAARRAHVVTTR